MSEYDRCRVQMYNPTAVFVFGSNLEGIHGAGAARTARRDYGARTGIGHGVAGRSYAIPTKSTPRKSLTLREVAGHVSQFKEFARWRDDLTFVVTRIGCGLAGFTDDQIKPLFGDAPDNCLLPEGWRE